jgi:hypothetical protein
VETILVKLVDASPLLVFFLLLVYLEYLRDQQRIKNATALEDRREVHEKAMQDKQIKHDTEVVSLYAAFNQELVKEIRLSHEAIKASLDEHEKESEERYKRLGITKDLLKAAAERTKR